MIIKTCIHCKKQIKYACNADMIRRSKTGFCRSCYLKNSPKESNSYNWKGGETMRNGYLFVYKPEHPRAGANGYVRKHRIIMEKHIGRFLDRSEVVHHIDGNKLNNSIDNLKIITQQEHAKQHSTKNRKCSLCDRKHCSRGFCAHHYHIFITKCSHI